MPFPLKDTAAVGKWKVDVLKSCMVFFVFA